MITLLTTHPRWLHQDFFYTSVEDIMQPFFSQAVCSYWKSDAGKATPIVYPLYYKDKWETKRFCALTSNFWTSGANDSANSLPPMFPTCEQNQWENWECPQVNGKEMKALIRLTWVNINKVDDRVGNMLKMQAAIGIIKLNICCIMLWKHQLFSSPIFWMTEMLLIVGTIYIRMASDP